MAQKLDLQPLNSSDKLDLQPLDIQPIEPSANQILSQATSNLPPSPVAEPTTVDTDNRSGLRKIWDFASSPLTDLPSRIGKSMGDFIDTRSLDESPNMAMLKGGTAGALQGIGDLVSGFSSPLNLATMSAGGLESIAAKHGLPAIAKLANIGLRALSAPVAAEGAYHIATGDTLGDKLRGIPELAGGIAGMASKIPQIGERVIQPPTTEPQVASSMGRSEPILDASGRNIAPSQTDMPIRPEGPWTTNSTPITEPITPPNEAGIPSFGALQKIGDNIVNPQTGELFDSPPNVLSFENGALKKTHNDITDKMANLTPDDLAELERMSIRDENKAWDYTPDAKPRKGVITLADPEGRGISQSEYNKPSITPQLVDEMPASLETPETRINSGEKIVDWNNKSQDRMGNESVFVHNLNGPGQDGYTTPTNAGLIEDTARMRDNRIRDRNDPIKVAAQKAKIDDWNRIQANLEATNRAEKENPNYNSLSDEEWHQLHSKHLNDVLAERGIEFPDISPTTKSSVQIPSLPRDLAGGKPRFRIGSDEYIPNFASDLDKALYIIAQKTPSKRNADYIKYAMKATGLPEAEVLSAGQKVRGQIKEILKNSEPGEVNIPQIHSLESSTNGSVGTTGPKPSNIEVLKSSDATPIKIKQMKEAGFELQEMTEDGNFVFKKTGRKTKQPILETEVKNIKPTKSTERKQLGPAVDEKRSPITEVINAPRTIMASVDMSAPLRQGLPLAHRNEFWKALPDMFKSFGSEEGFNKVQSSIAEKPLFRKRVGAEGEELPSFADQAGLKLTDVHGGISSGEEAFLSSTLSKIPGVSHSNRAYVAFLNKLRADTFESLVRDGKVFGANPEGNVPLARAIADFVNTATGRGSLGKLEPAAKILSNTFFAPRLIASRLKLLNPHYYWAADPFVRKEALKSLFTVAGSGLAIGQLARLAGAKVSADPNSADFGKIRIGNVHIDPFAGFQQYVVAASRIIQGKSTSTTTGNTYNLGEKFGRPTRLDVASRFAESKLNPVYTLALDILRGKDFTGQPVNVPEEVANRFVPLFMQDVKQLLTEDPNLIPGIHRKPAYTGKLHPENLLAAPGAFFGQGVQVYPGRYR